MGCCASTEGGSESGRVRRSEEKGASFTSMEEETVKEVLSETPARPACFISRDKSNNSVYRRNVENLLMMKAGGGQQQATSPSVTDEISEVYTAMAEGRDSNEYYNRNRNSQCQTTIRDLTPKSKSLSGRRSPAKKSSDPSPVRRNNSDQGGTLRSVTRRDSPQKPDSGERSGRRSRSPGMGRMEGSHGVGSRSGGVVGRSPSGRKMQGQSPKRGPRTESSGQGRGEGEGKWAQADESLENPLVALECFIFL